MQDKKTHTHKAQTANDQYEIYKEASETHHTGEASSRTDILLKNFVEAGKRTRNSLLAVSIASILILFGIFNHQLSWLATKEHRQHELLWPDDLKDPIDPSAYVNYEEALIAAINRLSENDKPKYPRHQIHELLEIEMKTIEVPILGIQIYIEDMPILGGIGISLLLLWLYFVRRRERSIVKMLHSVATYAKPQERKYQIKKIYTTLAFSQVFNTIPNVDKVAKSSFRKKLSALNIKPPISKLFYYFTPFIPCFVIAVTIIIDCRETFYLKSEYRLIPNVSFLSKTYPSFPLSLKEGSNYTRQTEFADSLFEQSQSDAYTIFNDSINVIRRDSLPFNAKVSRIKYETKQYRNKIKELKNSIYEPGTTSKFYKYRAHQFEDFLHHHPRLPSSWTLEDEIWWIRTILPIIILLFNFLVAWQAKLIAKSRDFHMEGIFIQYGKYYPQNYNLYEIGYAYVSILICDKTGKERHKGAVIKAERNFRSCKTNEQGFARFIELQELSENEIFEFCFEKTKEIMHCETEFKLKEIERFGKGLGNENSESELKKEIFEIMHDTNGDKEKMNKKSIIERIMGMISFNSEDDRNKPISVVTNKPISRLAATKELVRGEMLIRFTIEDDQIKDTEIVFC